MRSRGHRLERRVLRLERDNAMLHEMLMIQTRINAKHGNETDNLWRVSKGIIEGLRVKPRPPLAGPSSFNGEPLTDFDHALFATWRRAHRWFYHLGMIGEHGEPLEEPWGKKGKGEEAEDDNGS